MDQSASETAAIRGLAAVTAANKSSAAPSTAQEPATPSSASSLSLIHPGSISSGLAQLGNIANYPTHGVLQGVHVPSANDHWTGNVYTPNRQVTRPPEPAEMSHPPSNMARLQLLNRSSGVGLSRNAPRGGSSVIARSISAGQKGAKGSVKLGERRRIMLILDKNLIGIDQLHFGGPHEFDLLWDLCESIGAVVACSPISREDGPAEVQKAVRAAFPQYGTLLLNHGFSWATLSRNQQYFLPAADSGSVSGHLLSEFYVKQPCAIIYSNSDHPNPNFSIRVREALAPRAEEPASPGSDSIMIACSKCDNLFDAGVIIQHSLACSKTKKRKSNREDGAPLVKDEPTTPSPFSYDGMRSDRPIIIPSSADSTPAAKKAKVDSVGKGKSRGSENQDPLSDILEGGSGQADDGDGFGDGELNEHHSSQINLLSLFEDGDDFVPMRFQPGDEEPVLASTSGVAPITAVSSQTGRRMTRSSSRAAPSTR
ncbi:hypothetical protein M231_01826 [Tremella mesenterica]|uniref:Uncharacterized protein n=1 Tax=Tremella mesenterica TaxID=5217 RepID=A0A4Q1BSP2_TREME|nr:hypothetical protein M231_01826 [Tremella mesenterica]